LGQKPFGFTNTAQSAADDHAQTQPGARSSRSSECRLAQSRLLHGFGSGVDEEL
jgi:hypothetical protein